MEKLINTDGQVNLGFFRDGPKTINFEDFDLRNNMDKPINGLRKKMAVNQFQFIGLTGDDFILGVAIVNLKWVTSCFMYVYQPSSKTFKEYSWLKPFTMGAQVSNQPNGGIWSFKNSHADVVIQAEDGRRTLKLNVEDKIKADVVINEHNNYEPLAVCCRAGYNGWVFTQKSTALDFKGNVDLFGKPVDTSNLLASVDWSAGYMRRETFWHWASLSTNTSDGTKIGFNLAAGVNETSYTENGLWINDKLIKLDLAEFIFDRNDRLNTWFVKTSDGKIDLRFEPEGDRKEKIHAGLIASNFTQVFGRYYGTIKDESGESYTIDGAMGFCEDHFAKW